MLQWYVPSAFEQCCVENLASTTRAPELLVNLSLSNGLYRVVNKNCVGALWVMFLTFIFDNLFLFVHYPTESPGSETGKSSLVGGGRLALSWSNQNNGQWKTGYENVWGKTLLVRYENIWMSWNGTLICDDMIKLNSDALKT